MQGHAQMEPVMLRATLAATLILLAPVAQAAPQCDPAFASGIPRIVRKEAVAAVDASYTVRFWQFCKGREFFDLGNAASLTRTIAANPLLADPIKEKGWRVDDVKFVRVGDGFIDLWLHRDP
jgi:hypothetical protein